MTIVRVGTTKKYSEGWSKAFGKGKKADEPAPAKKQSAKKAKAKAAPKKKPAAKKGKRK